MHRRHTVLVLVFLLVSWSPAFAAFPTIAQGDIVPNDRRLGRKIGTSKSGELTIASFNIRNLGSRQRSLKDFEAIVNLIDEADVVLVQEAGLGVYRGSALSRDERRRLDAVEAIFALYLGEAWVVTRPPSPSGTGQGRETTLLAYRTHGAGFSIAAVWSEYVDLGNKRDMATFTLTLTREGTGTTKELVMGSVHLTPEDPDRGTQMRKVAEWLIGQGNNQAMVMGDFNWGYKKTSGVENYQGEAAIRTLHGDAKLFQVFHALSYVGKAKSTQLRTNMGFRKEGYFYDQFLTTPVLAGELADGGKLLQDAGMLAFGVHNRHMKDVIARSEKRRRFGLDKFLKYAPIDEETHRVAYAKALKDIRSQARNDATWLLSDHRVIWMQLKVW
jgi:endonuclease/exonuclease/phosphatase family metal-dependent hydrolase